MNLELNEGMLEYVNGVAKTNKWIVTKDNPTLKDLIDGLVENRKRFGYQSCPCRFASGNKELDRDLICPCAYAKPDIKEYSTCYCNLYMAPEFYQMNKSFVKVPERRPLQKEDEVQAYLKKESEKLMKKLDKNQKNWKKNEDKKRLKKE